MYPKNFLNKKACNAFTVLAVALSSMISLSHADSVTCTAEQSDLSEWCFYAGLGLGVSSLSSFDDVDSAWKVDNSSSTGMELTAGFHFLPRWFAEVSYTDFGAADLVNPFGENDEYADIAFSGLSLKGGYYLPVSWVTFGYVQSSAFQPFVKAGVASVSNSISDNRVKFDEGGGIKPQLAVGVDWRFADDWQARAQWEMTSEVASVTQLAVNYLFSFTRNKSITSPAAYTPVVRNKAYRDLTQSKVIIKKHKNKATYDRFYFQPASTKMDKESQQLIESITKILLAHPHLHISIMDAELKQRSSEAYKILSQQRAKKLRQLLIRQGIAAKRIDRNTYGKAVDNHYKAKDFFGRSINVKTLVLAASENDSWVLFNR
ncbi:MAG: outer membrane beta-barrel protein [Pseudomonadales bacterium]|nr:outer membrane beta-barrel protein [Pseudomonadales bacterium]